MLMFQYIPASISHCPSTSALIYFHLRSSRTDWTSNRLKYSQADWPRFQKNRYHLNTEERLPWVRHTCFIEIHQRSWGTVIYTWMHRFTHAWSCVCPWNWAGCLVLIVYEASLRVTERLVEWCVSLRAFVWWHTQPRQSCAALHCHVCCLLSIPLQRL